MTFSFFSYYSLCLNANNNKYSIDICIYKMIEKHLCLLQSCPIIIPLFRNILMHLEQINLGHSLPTLHPSGCYQSGATFTSNLKTTWIKPWFDVFLTLRPCLQQFMNATWGFVRIWEICGLSTLKVSQVVFFPLPSTFAWFRCLGKKDDDGNLEI